MNEELVAKVDGYGEDTSLGAGLSTLLGF